MAEPIFESSTGTVLNVAKAEAIKVLQVDDDQAFLKVAKRCLEMQGEIEVDTASSVNEASEKLKKTDYDVVVSDYQMPGKDGLEFLKELRENGNTVPFIVFTGKGREEVAIKALNLGANRYLNKVGETETVYTELAYSIKELARIRKAEEATRRSEEKFRSLVEGTAAPIGMCDLRGRFTYANKALVKFSGYSEQELMGHPFKDFLHPKDRGRVIRLFLAAVMLKREPYTFEFRAVDKGGHVLHLMCKPTRFIVSGKTIGFQAIMMDMTERKKAEEALRTSEEKHRVISGITADFVFSCVKIDEKGFAIDWMAGATDKIFGYSAKEIQDEGCWKFTVQPQDLPTFEEKVTGLKPGQSSVSELRITHKDGSTRWIKVSSQVVKDSNNPANYRLFGACKDITERKKADDAVLREKKFSDSLVDSSVEGILAFDHECHYTVWNYGMERISGISRKKALGKCAFDVFPFLKETGEDKLFYEALAGKTVIARDRSYVIPETGKQGFFEGYYSPIRDETSRIIGGLAIIRDITERKKMEEALLASEAKWRSITENSPDYIMLLDQDANISFINYTVPDLTRERVIGTPVYNYVPPEDRQRVKECLERVLKTGRSDQYDVDYHTTNGEIRKFENRVGPVECSGNIVGVAISCRDVTDRKLQEETLRQSEKKLRKSSEEWRRTFDSISDFMFILDTTFRFVRVNKAICDALKKEPKELIGKRCFEVLHGTDKPWPNCPYKKTFVTKEATTEEVNDPNFGFPLLVSVSPIFDDEGEFFGVVHIAKDITKLKDTEERLKETNRKLEATNEKLHVVGSLTRHDVRNKLSAVTGNAYLLRRKLAEDPKALEQLNDIEAAVRQVEGIFEFAGTYEKLGVEQLAIMDVGKVVDEAASLFSGLKSVKIVNECRGLVVLADSLLRQLFYNLIDNSLKYGGKVRQIRVCCKTPSANQREIIYEDDGAGISDNMRSNLFKEGYGRGTGHGLFMIKRICEVYGWAIQETGTQDQGVRFTITSPELSKYGKKAFETS